MKRILNVIVLLNTKHLRISPLTREILPENGKILKNYNAPV